MKKLSSKGFTLIELLAAISLLAIIMLMAIPNVVGIVQRNKYKTYIEDSKKLVTLAKYEISKNTSSRPSAGNIKALSLEYLDASKEIDDGPNGGKYDRKVSKVEVENISGTYEYKVTLVEKNGNKWLGVIGKLEKKLYGYVNITDIVESTSISSLSGVEGNTPSQVIDNTPPTVLIDTFRVNGKKKSGGYYFLKTREPFSADFGIRVCDNNDIPILVDNTLNVNYIVGGSSVTSLNLNRFNRTTNDKCVFYNIYNFGIGTIFAGFVSLDIDGQWMDTSGNKTSSSVIFGGEITYTKFYS